MSAAPDECNRCGGTRVWCGGCDYGNPPVCLECDVIGMNECPRCFTELCEDCPNGEGCYRNPARSAPYSGRRPRRAKAKPAPLPNLPAPVAYPRPPTPAPYPQPPVQGPVVYPGIPAELTNRQPFRPEHLENPPDHYPSPLHPLVEAGLRDLYAGRQFGNPPRP